MTRKAFLWQILLGSVVGVLLSWWVVTKFSGFEVNLVFYVIFGLLLLGWAISNERSAEHYPEFLKNDPIGETCTTAQAFERRKDSYAGKVLLNGELWEATSSEALAVGDKATIKARAGLRLHVEKRV